MQLFHLCLSIIDKSASKVLDSEEWEDISRELLEIILIRNTLRYEVLLIMNNPKDTLQISGAPSHATNPV